MSDLGNWQERLQSPVNTYNLSKPMTLQEFEALPKDLQREYLDDLRKKYGFGTRLAADMLGVTMDAFVARAQALGVRWDKTLLLRRAADYADARKTFLEGFVFPPRAQESPPPQEEYPNAPKLTALRLEWEGDVLALARQLEACAGLLDGQKLKLILEAV